MTSNKPPRQVVFQIVFEVDPEIWGEEEVCGADVFLSREAANSWAMCQGTEMNHEMGGVKNHHIEERTVQTGHYFEDEEVGR